MVAIKKQCVCVIFVLGLYICHGDSSLPEERGLIVTSFKMYYSRQRDNVQLQHLPYYPGYENISNPIPGVSFNNQNLHFLSVDVDYRTRCIYMHDKYLRTIVLGTDYNKDLDVKNMTFNSMHVGVSSGTIQVAVDWLSHTVYWSDSTFRWILAAPGQKDKIDKDYYKVIADRHLEAPGGVTVDPIAGYLFWSDKGNSPKIERSDLKGAQRHTIISKYVYSPSTLEADIYEKRLYWIESASGSVLSATYDGEDILVIQRIPESNLHDLAIFREVVYISDIKNHNVYTLNKTEGICLGKEEATTISFSKETIYGLALYGDENQPMKDKDFCAEKNCEHLCISTKDSAECICSDGYLLDNETGKCQETGAGFHKAIVVANTTHICLLDIRSFSETQYGYMCKFSIFKQKKTSSTTSPLIDDPIDDSPIETSSSRPMSNSKRTAVPIASDLEEIVNIDMDMENRIFFFATEGNIIYKRPIDLPIENDAFELVVEAPGNISGLAYDAGDSNNLYWCESDTGNIRVVNVVTKASKKVTLGKRGLTLPRDIVVILRHRKLAVLTSRRRYDSIQTVTMDGKTTEYVVRDRSDISSFTFDNENDMFYYILYGRYLYYQTFDGHQSGIILYSADKGLCNLLHYKNFITWVYQSGKENMYVKTTDLKTKSIVKNGQFDDTTISIVAMKVLDTRLQSTNVSSPCAYENGGCSQICMTKYVNDSLTLVCECRLGYALAEDGVSCETIDPVEDNFILVADLTNQVLLQINLETNGFSAIPLSEGSNCIDMCFDPKKKKLIWAEKYDHTLYSANLNGTDEEILFDLDPSGYVNRIDMDITSGNLYFTAYYSNFIGMVTPSGDGITLINQNWWAEFGDIVVHPGKGLLYFTVYGYGTKYVGRADMDGKNSLQLITGKYMEEPSGLAIDFIKDHLYWSDAGRDTIQRCNLDGKDCVTIVNNTGTYNKEEIRHLVTDGEFLYYSAYGNNHIVRVDLKEPYTRTVVGQNLDLVKFGAITFYSSKNKNVQTESNSCRDRNGLGDCSTFCLPTPRGRSCGCMKGVSLKPDGRTCSNVYQCTDIIEQIETERPGQKEIIDITFSSSCRRYLKDECHYKCPKNYKPKFNTLLTCTNVGWNLESETLCQEIKCPDFIENGKLDSNCELKVGQACNFKCDTGFIKSSDNVVCLQNGTYQIPESELCIPFKCSAQIDHGQLENCTREIGTSCNYNCDEYYTGSTKDLQITCQVGGWNADPTALCKEMECTDSSLLNGMVTGDCQRKIGNVCQIQCDRGYVNTTDVAVCKSDSLWHPKESCKLVHCPSNIPNGSISGICNFAIGATCNFKCGNGFRTNNHLENITCNINGQWNLSPCNEIRCPTAFNNGELSSECSRKVGSKCNFTCNDGFLPTTDTVVCTENGTYHVPDSKICNAFRCNERIENGALGDGCARTIGSSCRYKCNPNFISSVINAEITCQADGWNPRSTDICKENSTEPVCEDDSLPNGKITGHCWKKIGEACAFQCNHGYVNTTHEAVCQSNRLWYPSDACTVLKCSDTIENGTLAPDCSKTFSSSCEFSCNEYLSPKAANMVVTCQADGWNPSSTELCEDSVCADSTFHNGKLARNCAKRVGDACVLQCDQGYVNTTDVAICKSDYSWHPTDACTAVKCMPSIPNGEITGVCDLAVGTTCSFRCHDGFTTNEVHQNIACKSNGQWDVSVEELCLESKCTDSSFHNGRVAEKCMKKVGDACMFQCNIGYINTTDVTVCKNDYTWHPKEACSQILCQPYIANGKISGTCDLRVGTSCSFACNDGFATDDMHNVTCNVTGQWDVHGELCLAVTIVSEKLRDNSGLSVPGVTSAMAILGFVIVVLIVALILLLRRRKNSSRVIKPSVHDGTSTAFENPTYLQNKESSVYTKEENPPTRDDTTQQTICSEEEMQVDESIMDQVYSIEPLPYVADFDITDDKAVITHDSWLREREKTDVTEC